MASSHVADRSSASSAASSSDAPVPTFPAPPSFLPTRSGESPTRTPQRSPAKSRVGITMAQRQALIDNLQSEITQRARRLRAQYAMQAQGLRSRLEMRIHRIPMKLRNATLGDLAAQHADHASAKTNQKASPVRSSPQRRLTPGAHSCQPLQSPQRVKNTEAPPATSRSLQVKRTSSEMHSADKENETANPKKRSKRADQSRRDITKTGKATPSQVLSPKSNNVRPTPPSPFKMPLSPQKSGIARPMSPQKSLTQAVTAPTAAGTAKTADKPGAKGKARSATASRAPSRQAASASTASTRAKRGVAASAPASDRETRSSNASTATSATSGTTIVRTRTAASKNTARAASTRATASSRSKTAAASKADSKLASGAAAGAKRSVRKKT